MKKRLVPIVTVILVAGVLGVLINGLSGKASVNPGDKAVEFNLKDTTGDQHKLSDYKGKIVVLNFFASWCAPCVEEAPELEAFGKEYKDAELLIIAKGEPKKRVEKYISDSNSELRYLLDTKEDVSDDYQVIGQPETFIIDESGTIVERFSGPTTKESLIERIEMIHKSEN